MVVLNGQVDTEEVYVGWKAIAAALGVSVTTAKRWRRKNKLPAYKVVGQFRASRAEIKAWMAGFGLKKPK